MTHCEGSYAPEVGLVNPSNLNNSKTDQTNVSTAKPSEGKAAKVESDVVKCWFRCMYAEERTKLIGELVYLGIGTNDIENHEAKQSQLRFGRDRGVRKTAIIQQSMKVKLKNCQDWEGVKRKERNMSRAKLEGLIDRKSTRYKSFVNRTRDKINNTRREVQNKNMNKVAHLKAKVKMERWKWRLPENLMRYEETRIFSEDSTISPEELKGPVTIEGGKQVVTLGQNEIKILTRGPKFTIRRCLNRERYMVEMEKAILKEKWDRMSKGKEMEEEMSLIEEGEKGRLEEAMEELEARSRQIYDGQEKVLDFGNLRATDAKENKRVKFPKALSPVEEAKMEVRRVTWAKIYNDFEQEMCDEDGIQESNLTREEEMGLKSLKKRVKDGELVICQTDKSGRFAVLTLEQYEEAGHKHTKGDKEVDLEFVNNNERMVNGHCSMWMKTFNVGKNWKQEDRNREVKINHSLAVAPLKLMYKDHKGWTGHMGGPAPSMQMQAIMCTSLSWSHRPWNL